MFILIRSILTHLWCHLPFVNHAGMLTHLRSLYHVQKQHMIQFTVRQSYEHVDSLALIISWSNASWSWSTLASLGSLIISWINQWNNFNENLNEIKIVDLQGNSTALELLHKNNSIGGLILCYINEWWRKNKKWRIGSMTYKARLTCFHQVHFSVREIISTISGIIPIRVKQNTCLLYTSRCV